VAVNGRELAGLLGEMMEHWPVPVSEIALVGFSMGGLVARAAIDAGLAGGDRWIDVVRHVVTIAAPHAGSPIEKAVEVTALSLMVAPQTKPLAGFLRSRSAGIRDLHSGVDLPPSFEGIEHHVIAAVVTSKSESRVGAVVGDLVVRPSSAMGRVKLFVDNQAVIGGRRHFDILDDPALIDRVVGWIEPARADSA
jgi:pimeloyl-ACP methyl ester carboxylesterase